MSQQLSEVHKSSGVVPKTTPNYINRRHDNYGKLKYVDIEPKMCKLNTTVLLKRNERKNEAIILTC